MASEPFKLANIHGDIVGIVWFPIKWAEEIRSAKKLHRYYEKTKFMSLFGCPNALEQTMDVVSFQIEPHPEIRDAIMIFGITPSEFETIPGCMFAAGAAYTEKGKR